MAARLAWPTVAERIRTLRPSDHPRTTGCSVVCRPVSPAVTPAEQRIIASEERVRADRETHRAARSEQRQAQALRGGELAWLNPIPPNRRFVIEPVSQPDETRS
jgi:hypothetical protein